MGLMSEKGPKQSNKSTKSPRYHFIHAVSKLIVNMSVLTSWSKMGFEGKGWICKI